jgi:Beta-propeller repeat
MNKIVICLLIIISFLCLNTEGVAQVAINTDGSPPSANTILDLNPAIGKAFLPPTMNWAQIKAINPAKAGMVIYDSEFNCLRLYNGSTWVCLGDNKDVTSPPGSFSTKNYIGTAIPKKMVTDAAGNVYMTGLLMDSISLSSLPTIYGSGNGDVFIAKFNNTGRALWVRKAEGLEYKEGSSITIDASGNLYITGLFNGTATFGTLPSITSNSNSRDIFVVKYNSNGTALWVQKAGGISEDQSTSIAIDALGNVLVTGCFSNSISFGTLPSLTATGSKDIFIVKYNSSGTALWAQKAGGTGDDYGSSIASDKSNNVYLTGSFTGISATFGSLPVISSGSLVKSDVFVAKYNSSGIAQWVKKTVSSVNSDYSNSIALDTSGNIYVSGSFLGTTYFGVSDSIRSVGDVDIFIAKYNNNGTTLWVQRGGGSQTDSSIDLALDESGNVYITGFFKGTATFGNLLSITSTGNQDICLIKYNNNGIVQWVQKAGGVNNDSGSCIALDKFRNVYISGYFQVKAQFGNQIITSSFTNPQMFLMKYSE